MWLRGMIAHHRGAVMMAETESAQGDNPDAVQLARTIKSAQSKEITTMRGILGS
jgi:uncharacterized protein (DUF305 family)